MEGVKAGGRLRVPAKAGLWGVVSSLIARGIGAFGTPIFTRLLTPSEYGLYPLYSTWLGVVTAVATLGLAGSAIYRGLQRYGNRRNDFLSAALGLFFTIFLPLSAIVMLFSGAVEGITGLSPIIVGMLLSEVLFSTVIAFASARARYEYKYKSLAAINIIGAVLSPTIAILFVVMTPYHSEARILGSLISSFLVALPLLFSMLGKSERLYNKEMWRYLISVSVPFVPHIISASLIVRASEMVIATSHGESALARYSVAMSVGLALSVLSGGLGQFIGPWLLRRIGGGEFHTIRETVSLAAKVMMLGAMLLVTVAPEMMMLLAPPEYRDALLTVYPLALGSVAQFISQTVMSGETYYERSARASLPTVITAVITVLLSLVILPVADYRVAGAITLFAYLMQMGLSLLSFRALSGEKLLHGVGLLRLFALGGGYCALMLLFRDVWQSRLLFLIALALFSLPYLPRVWQVVKE